MIDDLRTFDMPNEYGEMTTFEVLFTFEDRETGKNYVIYTDDSLDENGGTRVFAGSFVPGQEPAILQAIETEEEWELIAGILDTLQAENMAE